MRFFQLEAELLYQGRSDEVKELLALISKPIFKVKYLSFFRCVGQQFLYKHCVLSSFLQKVQSLAISAWGEHSP